MHSANPQRRKSSIVRADVVFAHGRTAETAVRGSITVQPTPWWCSSMAKARPTGPVTGDRTGSAGGHGHAGSVKVGQEDVLRNARRQIFPGPGTLMDLLDPQSLLARGDELVRVE